MIRGGATLRPDWPDWVESPHGGRIAMIRCPGSRAREGEVGSDPLDTDLERLRAWGAQALVSLVEAAEIEMLGIDSLGERCAAMGLWWVHLPIPDMCAPDHAFEARWEQAGPRLRGLLAGGGRVALHCWAGLGRTGTVAARLLVELGVDPARAIHTVRAARPGAIQSLQQEIHVRRCRAVA